MDSLAWHVSRALRWVQLEHGLLFADQHLLADYQCGWLVRLYLACCRSPIPGYYGPIVGSSAHALWKLVGAHTEEQFAHRAPAVLAAFHIAECDGEKYLYYPPLLEAIYQQINKLQKRRGWSFPDIPSFSTAQGEQLPLVLFQILKKEAQKESSARSVAEPMDDSEEMWAFRVKHAFKTQGTVTGELAEWAKRLGIDVPGGKPVKERKKAKA